MQTITIAIDGPAGAGKSTAAKLIAKKLDFLYLDTGAMYRAVAFKAIKNNIDTKDRDALSKLMSLIDLRIENTKDGQKVYIDNEDVSRLIRTQEVTIGSSDVSAYPEVREKMVDLQREISLKKNIVMDGRDIGTHVLPNADYKFFVTASLEERAKRRYLELVDKGEHIKLDEVKLDIQNRDLNDSTRKHSPLKQAKDAILVDSTDMSIEQVVEYIMNRIGSKE